MRTPKIPPHGGLPSPKSHHGKLRDRSYTAYTTRRAKIPSPNPTNAVGGSFIYSLQGKDPRLPSLSYFLLATRGREGKENGSPACVLCRLCLNNPPTALVGFSEFSHSLGSGWMVQAQPNLQTGCLVPSRNPNTAVGGCFKPNLLRAGSEQILSAAGTVRVFRE